MAKKHWRDVGKALGLPQEAGSPGKEEAVNNSEKNIWAEAAKPSDPDAGAATSARLDLVRGMIARTKPANVVDQPIEGVVPTFRFWVHDEVVQTDNGPRFKVTGGHIGPVVRKDDENVSIFGHFSVGYINGQRWSSAKAGYYWHLVMDDHAAKYVWEVIKANQDKAVQILVYAPTWEYDTVEDPQSGERVIKTYPNKKGVLIAAGRLNRVSTQYVVVVAEAGSNDPYFVKDNAVTAQEELANCNEVVRKSVAAQIAERKAMSAIEEAARGTGLEAVARMVARRAPDKVSDYEPDSER